MEQSKLVQRLEGYRRRNTTNPGYVNEDLYRLFYSRDLYIIAYNSVKSNDGAETSGADGTSLHGFCEEWITQLITSMRDESYQPQPNRTTMIPKKSGKLRKLSFPNGKDKLVQEAIRIILECIYEPTFSNLSHGFRPKRSTQSAIAEVQTWRGTIWFIEGDISACFDDIDHRTLETILRERIRDERFIRLVNKVLKAGYFDMQHLYQKTKTGNAQGSCCSPLLCNIYLDKLDRFMENVMEQDTMGGYRRQNPDYAKARYLYKKALKSGSDPQTVQHLKRTMEHLPTTDRYDPNFRRVNYVRYADDFLIGVIASKKYALDLKLNLKEFLQNELSLRLSDEKTKITHAADKDVSFLGYILRKGSVKHSKFQNHPFDSTLRVYMNTEGILNKLRENGMCTSKGYPMGITRLLREPPQDIIHYGNQVLRGLLTQQRGCFNFYRGWRIQYIVQFSIAKTLARKFDISLKKVFARYGKALNIHYQNAKGKACSIRLALYTSFARHKDFFTKIKLDSKAFLFLPLYSLKDPLARVCYICGNPQSHVSMYHRKTKKKLPKPYSPMVTLMLAINRRQIPLCQSCFTSVGTDRFQLNQLKRR
ncbi:Group II intron-encoded protein LtrA [bioreactor metagenome]|uniref:Group II intron-encoded protein LtrA n=1 Tax=bioreactor metagenome TaxID=1076179 RepID=A0A644T9V8_9ZZZZ|nr:reverse transcriptase domain-containing protein [Desulfitobacterium hafniense]MEA5024235.1 reverse transcriptase domain-containing protein [Desulfitobacterium hafniense]